jgi:hypothetical protein
MPRHWRLKIHSNSAALSTELALPQGSWWSARELRPDGHGSLGRLVLNLVRPPLRKSKRVGMGQTICPWESPKYGMGSETRPGERTRKKTKNFMVVPKAIQPRESYTSNSLVKELCLVPKGGESRTARYWVFPENGSCPARCFVCFALIEYNMKKKSPRREKLWTKDRRVQ